MTSEQHLNEKNGRVAEFQKPRWISVHAQCCAGARIQRLQGVRTHAGRTRLIRQGEFEDLPRQQAYLSALTAGEKVCL